MKDLVLQHEINNYTDKTTGEVRKAVNLFVLVDTGSIVLKIQLRPADFTSREVLNALFIKEG